MSNKRPINLDDLLRQRTVEGDRIEYKAGWKTRTPWCGTDREVVSRPAKSFHGPLSEQVRDALRYLQSNAIREKVIKHKDRAEATRIYNYPY